MEIHSRRSSTGMDSLATSTEVGRDEDLLEFIGDKQSIQCVQNYRRWSPDTAVGLQTGEIPVEISVDDLRLRIYGKLSGVLQVIPPRC